MVRRRRWVGMAATGALGVSCLTAIGCGSSSGSGSAAAPDPLASLTPARVLAEAVADLKAAPSLTADSAGVESGLYITDHIGIVPGKGCTGAVMGGWFGAQGTYTYITIGQTVYVKPDSAMWQAIAGSNAAKDMQLVGGRYIEVPLSDVKLQADFGCGIPDPPRASVLTKGQVTMLNGIKVLPLTDPSGGVLYVTDTSKPVIVQDDTAPAKGTTEPASETIWAAGAPVTLTLPPASQVVNGASIGL